MARRKPMTERVIFRVTEADKHMVEAAAAHHGDRLSDYVRDHVREAARRDLVGTTATDTPSDR